MRRSSCNTIQRFPLIRHLLFLLFASICMRSLTITRIMLPLKCLILTFNPMTSIQITLNTHFHSNTHFVSASMYLCPQLFARIICRALAHIVWRKVRRLASIQSPIWNTYSTETREAKLRQCLSPTVLLFDMWRESHIFNKIVTTHNHTSEESVVVIYNLTWFSMSIMVSQCLSWSI